MTKLERKQDKLIYQLLKQPNAIGREWRERVEKLESEIAALKQGEPVSDKTECYNCKGIVRMISRGEFCPHCMCDQ